MKHSYLVTDINEIPRVVKEAFYIAQSGRPGPVVIDLPKNIQQQQAQPVWPTDQEVKSDLRGYTQPDLKADDLALNEIMGLIEKAERPVVLKTQHHVEPDRLMCPPTIEPRTIETIVTVSIVSGSCR